MRRVLILGAVVLIAGCGVGSQAESTKNGECDAVTVFAASSFGPIVEADSECLGQSTVSLASSTVLAAQISDGAPVDVFVSAGIDAVNALESMGVTVGKPITIAFNSAALMVSTVPGLADSIDSIEDLKNQDVLVGACVESAPCGKLFDEVMSRVNGLPTADKGSVRKALVDTEVLNAADLVSKISLGEVDTGIVYASDCAQPAMPELVRCIAIPDKTSDGKPLNSKVPYVVVQLSSSTSATAMFRYLTSPEFLSGLRSRFGLEAP